MTELPHDLDADRLQTALTQRFLTPALPALEQLLFEVRAETDRALQDKIGAHYGRSYPYGCCLEITADVLARLRARTGRPRSVGERALNAFVEHGGEGRMVWGVLRDRYFQNAIQLGSLYVDVSNDTVDPTKPKVEISPMRDSGLALVRDAAHFVRIGEAYWGARLYANVALPALAPLFPMILVNREGRIQLQTRNAYMLELFGKDGFRRSEQWLREGPRPSLEIVQALREVCPPDILADNPVSGADASIAACRRLRAERISIGQAWIDQMCGLFDRIPVTRFARAAPKPVGLANLGRSNTRPGAGIRNASG